ncbi:hypothetical protein Phi19:3_gp056 [Cellulophaga phage phi19:3]|uniref:Uncharacterized protein n=1 Tax=Cellulophaga phage phi19:3 TaxID=1327971 RepID=R9ZY64_9CAUD|nr:hypothetical protein Phi19:3_gp056 [Cellulophaga phage phi19:3]AGO47460.1 hypothetical protein Phi19:3_gp056 [Cellulophaga phage phi19:3]
MHPRGVNISSFPFDRDRSILVLHPHNIITRDFLE